MPIVNKPDMNYGTWAENGNIEIPSSEKVEEGWVIEKPLNEHMNWLQNRQDKMLQYLNQRGMSEWDFRTEYPTDSYVVRSGVMYQAISQNVDSDPTLNPDIWEIPFASKSILEDFTNEIEKIKNQSGYLTHYVISDAPVMTSIAQGVGYANSENTASYGFVDDVATVTRNSETIATFSGGEGLSDIVTHAQLNIKIQNYRIGDIYLTTADGNPFTRLGYGTWERFAEGEVLVGFSTSVSNSVPQWVKTAGSRFGAYVHKLVTGEIPSHSHDVYAAGQDSAGSTGLDGANSIGDSLVNSAVMKKVGGDEPHNNVQPSIVVYIWKRIA